MSTKYLQGPKTTSQMETPSFVTVTHPYHPLHGYKLELMMVPHKANSKLLVRHPEGKSLRIPRDWTDYDAPQAEQTETVPAHLLDIKGLREIAKFMNNLDSENLRPDKKM